MQQLRAIRKFDVTGVQYAVRYVDVVLHNRRPRTKQSGPDTDMRGAAGNCLGKILTHAHGEDVRQGPVRAKQPAGFAQLLEQRLAQLEKRQSIQWIRHLGSHRHDTINTQRGQSDCGFRSSGEFSRQKSVFRLFAGRIDLKQNTTDAACCRTAAADFHEQFNRVAGMNQACPSNHMADFVLLKGPDQMPVWCQSKSSQHCLLCKQFLYPVLTKIGQSGHTGCNSYFRRKEFGDSNQMNTSWVTPCGVCSDINPLPDRFSMDSDGIYQTVRLPISRQ